MALHLFLCQFCHQGHTQAEALIKGKALMFDAEVADGIEDGIKFLQIQIGELTSQFGKAVPDFLVVVWVVFWVVPVRSKKRN